MTTIANLIARQVVARLKDTTSGAAAVPPPPDKSVANIRRIHRVSVSRDEAPAIHVIDGLDRERESGTKNTGGCVARFFDMTVSLFVRDDFDDVFEAADPHIEEILRRIGSDSAPYDQAGVTTPRIKFLTCNKDTDIADGDAVRVDLAFRFSYDVNGPGLS